VEMGMGIMVVVVACLLLLHWLLIRTMPMHRLGKAKDWPFLSNT